MSELMISRAFVKKLASNIRVTYGKEVKHTDVIELVAGSLGWKADALMHKLKSPETTTGVSPDVMELSTVWPEGDVRKVTGAMELKKFDGDDKFMNMELLETFFNAVIQGNSAEAKQFAPLISERNAWCCLALAFHHYTPTDKPIFSESNEVAEKYLLKAFKADADTVRYVAQLVGMDFSLTSHESMAFFEANKQIDDKIGRFVRSDLMAWAVCVARRWGFLVSDADGLKVVRESSLDVEKLGLDTNIKKIDFMTSNGLFWDYFVEEKSGDADEKALVSRLNRMRYPVLKSIIIENESRSLISGVEPEITEVFNVFKPEGLVSIANGSFFPHGISSFTASNMKIVSAVIEEMTGVSVIDGGSIDHILSDKTLRAPLDEFYNRLVKRCGALIN